MEKKDIKNLQFPIEELDFKDKRIITDIYPRLKLYPEFNLRLNGEITIKALDGEVKTEAITGLSEAKVFAYIALICDKQSPFRIEDDIFKRKIETAVFCQFDKKENRFTDNYESVIAIKNPIVSLWTIRYLRMQGDMEWATLSIYRENYFTDLGKLSSVTEEKDRKTSLDNLAAMRKAITDLMQEFTGKETNRSLIDMVNKYFDYENVKLLTPENIVIALKEGKDPTAEWNPHKKK